MAFLLATMLGTADVVLAAERLTIGDAVATALGHGSDAHIARLEADQAEDALGEARSAYWPHLEVTSGAGYSNRQNAKLRAVNGNGVEKVYGLRSIGSNDGWINVEIEQILFDLSNWRRIEQRELEAEAARMAEDERRDATAQAVLARYATVLRLEEQSALAAERAQQAEWLDGQARVLFAAGRAVATERDQTHVAAAEAALASETRAAELADARAALQLAMGDPSTDVAQLDPTSLPAATAPPAPVADDVLAATPALRVLDLRKRMEESGIAAARAERYPTVGMQAGYANYGPNRYDNYPDEVSVNVAFRMPLFDGHRATYAVANATKGAEIAQLRYRAMLDAKRTRVRELASRLAATRESPELAVRRAAIARERVRLADVGLQAERGSLADAMAARETWAHDAGAAIDARYDRLAAWADLMRETGRLATTLLDGRPVPVPASESAE